MNECTEVQIHQIIKAIPLGWFFFVEFRNVCRICKDFDDFKIRILQTELCDTFFNRENLFLDKNNTLKCKHDGAGVFFYAEENKSYIPFEKVLEKLWEYAGENGMLNVDYCPYLDKFGNCTSECEPVHTPIQTCQGKYESCEIFQKEKNPMSYRSEDVYISPDGTETRIHYIEKCGYHSEFRGKGEKKWNPFNSSFYPHFPDACNEFEAFVRRMNLKKQEESDSGTSTIGHEIDDFNAKQISMQKDLSKIEDQSDDELDLEETECENYMSGHSTPDAGSESQPADEVPDVSRADAPTAMSTRQDAEAASLAPAFDYSGLDAQTVATLHSAESMIKNARKDYVLKVADAVGMAHDELIANCEGHNQHSEETFASWCRSVGISKDTAYRLLQVSNLLDASSPNEQKILEQAPASLLYSAAKPSAPPELVQQVKSGDITTNKQYQDALKEIQELRADRVNALNRAKRAEKEKSEQAKQLEASRGLVKMLKEHQGSLRDVELDRDAWKQRAKEAENRPTEVAVDETASEKRAHELAEQYRKEDQAVIDQLKSELEKQATPPLSDEDSTELFNVGLQFCATIRNAWKLARKSCMVLGGQDRYQTCENINNLIREIKGDMSKCQ